MGEGWPLNPGEGKATASAKSLPTLNSIDVLVKNFAPLKGKRIGLVTNHTGQDRARRATIDLLKNAPDVTLVALFGPEHGIRGEVDERSATVKTPRPACRFTASTASGANQRWSN